VARHKPVDNVDEPWQPERFKQPAEGSRQPDLRKQSHATSAVAADGCAIAQNKPPAFVALFLWDCREHVLDLGVRQREKGQLLASIDGGDDPRRPTAEPSAVGIEQNRTWKGRLHRDLLQAPGDLH
jgi:hypothetical protein